MKALKLIISLIVILIILASSSCRGSAAGKPLQTMAPVPQGNPVTFAKVIDAAKYETASCILELPDSTYLVTGQTSLTANGASDGYMVRIDGHGNVISGHIYDLPGDEYFFTSIEAGDGGYINLGVIKTPGLETFDLYLTKVDGLLNPVWQKSFGDAGNQNAAGLIRTKDGNYALLGDTKAEGSEVGDFYLVKVDTNGKLLWEKTYGTTEANEFGRGLTLLDDGGFFLVGVGGSSHQDAYLVRTDANGKQIWVKTAGREYTTWANSITRADKKNYLVAGMTQLKGVETIYYEMYLLKINLEGEIQWQRSYGFDGTNVALAQGICPTQAGNFILGGMSRKVDEIGTDMAIMEVDKEGNQIWQTNYDVQGGEYGNYVLPSRDGHFLLAGFTARREERDVDGMHQILYVGRVGLVVKFDSAGRLN